MKINNDLTPPLFKCRSSALGQLMTEPRAKKETLSATAKSMLTLWYKEQLYDRRKPIESKYMEKGNECEDASIAMLDSTWTNNKEQFSNDWITGEPDVITEDAIIDIKNSWDFTTFPLFSKEAKKEYQWQVLGYMWMCGKKEGEVVHTLMDTPADLVQKEWEKIAGWNVDMDEGFAKDHKYEYYLKDKPYLIIKRFEVEYNEEKIEKIKNKVEEARRFISNISI